MVDMQANTLYQVEPQVLTQVSGLLQETVKNMSLSLQRLPIERSLMTTQQNYEWRKKNNQTGIGFELDPVSPPDVADFLTKVEKDIPVAYFNKALGYDEYLREQMSAYNLNERLQDHLEQLALRLDIYNYVGDSKHAIDNLITATPGTEITVPLDVTTTLLARSTINSMIGQLKAALKYGGLITPQSEVVIEVTPAGWSAIGNNSAVTEDYSVRDVWVNELRANFSAASNVYENHILDSTVTINKAGVHTITNSAALKALVYVRDPRIMKAVQSPLEIRQSALDPTSGITFQPLMRNRRIDVEALGVLIETAIDNTP